MHKVLAARILLAVVTLAYPVVVYLCLGRLEPRWLALLLVALALMRLAVDRSTGTWGMVGAALLLTLFSWFGHGWMPLKLYPVGMNGLMLAIFGSSLFQPQSAVERIARLAEPDLPVQAIAYTRRVTQVWCVFFVVNGLIALATALWASDALWALYNGFVAYCLMGLLGGGEWLVRRRVRGRIDALNELAARGVHG